MSVIQAERIPRVVLTDHPWPDLDIEARIFADAGIELIAGPIEAPNAASVERMVADGDPDAIMTCWAQVNARAVERPGRLRIVARLGIGLDNIAVDAATRRGAWVTNVPSYCVGEVSDHAIALLLAHVRGVVQYDQAAKAGRWDPSGARLCRVADLVIGIIGYGQIGRETGRKLAAFGCTVLAHSRSLDEAPAPIEVASLDRIRDEADVIILHAPLTPQTRHMIDRDFLRACRRTPFLINVSRGDLVDNDALLAALDEGLVRGAALDVIEGEPKPPLALLRHPRAIVTPHISFSSTASLADLRRSACEEVVRVLKGSAPLHPCNTPFAPGVPLEGGIASDIRVIEGPNGPEVIKQALPQLRTRDDWFADPARSMIEVKALRTAADLLGPEHVPAILWTDSDRHCFAMSLIDPAFRNWKLSLLQGRIEPDVAQEAGRQLGILHSRSATRDDIRDAFRDTANFEGLRIEPFFTRTAAQRPDLASAILSAATGMDARRSALVHGDYSPKNLLTDGTAIVVLDWEVAHWGDPRFDVAFCLSHLLLKAFRLGADRTAMMAAARRFGHGYRAEHASAWDDHLPPLVGALLLSRLVGGSPVDYLESVDRPAVTVFAEALLDAQTSIGTLDRLLGDPARAQADLRLHA